MRCSRIPAAILSSFVRSDYCIWIGSSIARVVVSLEVGELPFKITGVPEQHMVESFVHRGRSCRRPCARHHLPRLCLRSRHRTATICNDAAQATRDRRAPVLAKDTNGPDALLSLFWQRRRLFICLGCVDVARPTRRSEKRELRPSSRCAARTERGPRWPKRESTRSSRCVSL